MTVLKNVKSSCLTNQFGWKWDVPNFGASDISRYLKIGWDSIIYCLIFEMVMMNSAMRPIDPLCLCDSQVMANLIAAGDDYNDDQVWAVCNLSVCLSSISSFVILVININVYSLGKLRSVSYRSMTIKATFWEEDAKENFLWMEQNIANCTIVKYVRMSVRLSEFWMHFCLSFAFRLRDKELDNDDDHHRQWTDDIVAEFKNRKIWKFIWLFIWNFYFILLLLA